MPSGFGAGGTQHSAGPSSKWQPPGSAVTLPPDCAHVPCETHRPPAFPHSAAGNGDAPPPPPLPLPPAALPPIGALPPPPIPEEPPFDLPPIPEEPPELGVPPVAESPAIFARPLAPAVAPPPLPAELPPEWDLPPASFAAVPPLLSVPADELLPPQPLPTSRTRAEDAAAVEVSSTKER